MDISGQFILTNGIVFLPASSLAETIKGSFGHEEDDVVISLMNTRETSKVISNDLAMLLQEFNSPRTLAEAIHLYSAAGNKDPQHVADEVFESLLEMHQWGFLIPYNPANLAKKRDALDKDSTFKDFIVVEKYRELEDSGVYRVKNAAETSFVLKVLKADSQSNTESLFKNEVSILQKLDNTVNPELIDYGTENENMFVVTSWRHGITCDREAFKYRNTNSRNNLLSLLDLSVSILKAYQHLHDQDVMHGDVNPGNILVSPEGAISIIDYGYAISTDSDQKIQRGGTGIYYEPEFAITSMCETIAPPVSKKGEQYSLAVLIYQLITGTQYLNFSFERKKFFNQIANDQPISFKDHDLVLPIELNNALGQALSKDPEKRFESLAEFASALAQVRSSLLDKTDLYIPTKQDSSDHFVSFFTKRYGWESPFIEEGFFKSPACSINYGAAGIAYMFYRLSCLRQDPKLSSLADVWASKAATYKDNYAHSFYAPLIGITGGSVGQRSLFHGPPGVHLVQALISSSKNDLHTLNQSISSFIKTTAIPCDKMDVTLGKAGLLIGCSLLYKELIYIEDCLINEIKVQAEKIKTELWLQLDGYAHINEPNPVDYFGIAHGWAGILYATLLWSHTTSTSLPDQFLRRITQLSFCSIQDDRGIRWPLSTGNKNSWPGWCNGNAGYIFLWILMFKHFNDTLYLEMAEKSAAYLINGKNENNPDLCCGTSGIAYAMLCLYRATNEEKYLQEALKIKQSILHNWFLQPLRNNSLYKGEPGIAVLFAEMEVPLLARMPMFE